MAASTGFQVGGSSQAQTHDATESVSTTYLLSSSPQAALLLFTRIAVQYGKGVTKFFEVYWIEFELTLVPGNPK